MIVSLVRSINEWNRNSTCCELMAATISSSPLICLFASMLLLLHETQRFALRKAPARDHLGSADWMDITANFCQWSRRLCHQQVRKFKLMRITHHTNETRRRSWDLRVSRLCTINIFPGYFVGKVWGLLVFQYTTITCTETDRNRYVSIRSHGRWSSLLSRVAWQLMRECR